MGRARLRLLRDRPTRATGAACASTRPPTSSPTSASTSTTSTRLGPDHRARRARPRGRDRPLDRRPHAALWADEGAPLRSRGSALNSPWLDLRGSACGCARPGTAVVRQHRRPSADAGDPARDRRPVYVREPAPRLRRRVGLRPGAQDAEVVAGLRRVAARHPRRPRRVHARARRSPARCWCSDLRAPPSDARELSDDVHSHDIVLDVAQIRRWSTSLGRHVT